MPLVEWLQAIGLEQYAELFAKHKLDMDVLPELTDGDFEKIGVSALGDRRRLLKAISALSSSEDSPPNTARPAIAEEVRGPRKFDERRQLTVMFCDLVGSTELASKLDPEDLRELMTRYHRAVTDAVVDCNGYVAQLLGDGALVYFGYPEASENDAVSAVRAAFGVISAVAGLSAGRKLQTRVGIATGRVVVGDIGSGTTAADLSAIGEAPNLAARLQALAAPDSIVVSEATRKLVGPAFETESLGHAMLKGFPVPVQSWRVIGERHAESLFDAGHPQQGLADFVGRDSEVALLTERWHTACDGEGQIVLLSGEPGIGKSRITQVMRRHIGAEDGFSILLQCSPYHRNSALYPAVHALEFAADVKMTSSVEERETALSDYLQAQRVALEPPLFDALVRMMTPPEQWRPLSPEASPQEQKQRVFQALSAVALQITRRRPVLLVVEDAHWIDPTTEEWLETMLDQVRQVRMLLVITTRPEYRPAWGNPLHWTELPLSRLSQRHAAALVRAVAAGLLVSGDAADEIVSKSDGVPLFIEELTKTVVSLEASAGVGPARVSVIPSTLQDSLMARLDRLGEAKEVAQVAAGIGRDFGAGLLANVMQLPEAVLDGLLERLIGAGIVFRRGSGRGASYSFKHAMLRDIAYDSMVKDRRAMLHGKIAHALERTQPEMVAAQPEILALHLQEAGRHQDAVQFWSAAGDLAWSRSVGREAASHYASALALVDRLPESVFRSQLELGLSLKRGHALASTEGYASLDTCRSYERARDVAQQLGRLDDYVRTWSSLAPSHFGRGNASAIIDAMKAVTPAQLESLDSALRVSAMCHLGVAHFLRAEMDDAWRYLRAAMALDDAEKITHKHPVGGADPAVAVRAYSTRLAAMQGNLEQGEALALQAIEVAQERGHMPSIAWAMQISIPFLLLKGEFDSARFRAEQMVAIASKHGIKTRMASGWVLLGRAYAEVGDVDRGGDLLRRGYDLWEAAGGKFHLTEWGAQAADALIRAGQLDGARRFVADAQLVQDTTDQPYYGAELLRLWGRILEHDGNVAAAEVKYMEAIKSSQASGLKLFTLRSACDLVSLSRRVASGSDATPVLQRAYDAMAEGRAFCDLRAARELLVESRAQGASSD